MYSEDTESLFSRASQILSAGLVRAAKFLFETPVLKYVSMKLSINNKITF
jgi:hypothetical protein